MFTGEYNHQLDEKNRIRIPARLRKDLGDKFYFARGAHGCIYVFPEPVINKYLEELAQIKITDLAQHKNIMNFTRSITEGVEDSYGRVALNTTLRQCAQMKKEIVFIGMVNHIEIWAKEVFEGFINSSDDQSFDDGFAQLGI